MSKQILDSLDRQILKLISQDARIPFLEVARACNVSGAAIHQRVAKLTNLGIIKGSQFVIDPEKIGYETCAYMGLPIGTKIQRKQKQQDFIHKVILIANTPKPTSTYTRRC